MGTGEKTKQNGHFSHFTKLQNLCHLIIWFEITIFFFVFLKVLFDLIWFNNKKNWSSQQRAICCPLKYSAILLNPTTLPSSLRFVLFINFLNSEYVNIFSYNFIAFISRALHLGNALAGPPLFRGSLQGPDAQNASAGTLGSVQAPTAKVAATGGHACRQWLPMAPMGSEGSWPLVSGCGASTGALRCCPPRATDMVGVSSSAAAHNCLLTLSMGDLFISFEYCCGCSFRFPVFWVRGCTIGDLFLEVYFF